MGRSRKLLRLRVWIRRAADRIRLDLIANGLFWLIVVLWATGGVTYRSTFRGQKVFLEAAQLDPWVLGLLILLAIWKAAGRSLEELRFIRILESVWAWVANKGNIFVYGFIAFSAVLFAGISTLRHISFHSGIDLAIFAQAYWQAVFGEFLFSSLKGNLSLWGEHFNPIILPILAIYRIWPSPEVLVIIQGLAVAAGAFPLYALAKKEIGDQRLALLIPVMYLFYYPLRAMVWADFHPIALATPLILAAFYYLRNDRYGWFFFFAVLICLTKETAPIAVGLLGAWCGFAKRRWLLGAGIILASFLWFYVSLNVIVPAFHPEGRYIHTMRYHYLGNGIGEILKTLVTRPLWAISINLSPLELKYPFRLFGPVAFLSFLTPAGLLAIPYFLMNWLEAGAIQVSLYLHYQAELTAFLFIGTVYGVKRALWWRLDPSTPRTTPNLNRVKAIGGILMAGSFLFFHRSAMFRLREFWPGEEVRAAKKALALLPPGASVSADDQIAPHLGDRRRLFFFPKTDSVEFVVLIGRLPRKGREEETKLEQKGFRLIFSENSVRVYRHPDPDRRQPES